MKLSPLLTLAALALPMAAQAVFLTVPNASFEQDGANQYGVPTQWQEDQPRVTGQFANSGRVEATNGLTPIDGTIMARLAMNGDSDSGTAFTGTMSTTLTDTFAADREYTLTFYSARDGYVSSGEWFAVGGLRANGTDIAMESVDAQSFGEDTWGLVTVSFSTVDNPSVVGQNIEVFVGMRHEGNYNKQLYFDDVQLESVVPEPSTYAMIAGAFALGLAWLRRRR